jgi:hypothetical protein
MRSRTLSIAVLCVCLASLVVPRRAAAQGVVSGSITAGPLFNLPNELVTVGFSTSATAERRDGLLGIGAGLEVICAKHRVDETGVEFSGRPASRFQYGVLPGRTRTWLTLDVGIVFR